MAQYSKDSLFKFNDFILGVLSFYNIASISADLKISSKAKMPEFGNVTNLISRYISVYNTLLRKSIPETTWSPVDGVTFGVDYDVKTNVNRRIDFSSFNELVTTIEIYLKDKCSYDLPLATKLNGEQISYLYKMLANGFFSVDERRRYNVNVPYGIPHTCSQLLARVNTGAWHCYLVEDNAAIDSFVNSYGTFMYHALSFVPITIPFFTLPPESVTTIIDDMHMRDVSTSVRAYANTGGNSRNTEYYTQNEFVTGLTTDSINNPARINNTPLNSDIRTKYGNQICNTPIGEHDFLENLKNNNFVETQMFVGEWPHMFWTDIAFHPNKYNNVHVQRFVIAGRVFLLVCSNRELTNLNQIEFVQGYSANFHFNKHMALHKPAMIEYLDFIKRSLVSIPDLAYRRHQEDDDEATETPTTEAI